MDNRPTQSLSFFQAWLEAVQDQESMLRSLWRSKKEFSHAIMNWEDSILKTVAIKLGLEYFLQDYYFLDSVLYKKSGLVPNFESPPPTWLREIEVAFEHENNFYGDPWKEISHLLLTRCELRVLVTYPGGEFEKELAYFHEIINGTSIAAEISKKENFLLIFGFEGDFSWEGRVFKTDGWKRIHP